MDMPMSTTTGAMPSATGMDGMDMSNDTMSDSMMMTMMFTISARTPLYSESWTPTTDGQYAGTCIFLIALAVIERFLLALRPILESRVWCNNTHHASDDDKLLAHHHHPGQYVDPNAVPGGYATIVGRDFGKRWSGWKIGTSSARATYELLVSGIAYLLMLAVMTMNLGYFLSVLGGIWLGTFVLGHLAGDSQWSHW